MNRTQRRQFYKDNSKRLQQLMSSKIVHTKAFDGMDEEEINLLKENKHTDKEKQELFNKQKKLVLELDYLLRKR